MSNNGVVNKYGRNIVHCDQTNINITQGGQISTKYAYDAVQQLRQCFVVKDFRDRKSRALIGICNRSHSKGQ